MGVEDFQVVIRAFHEGSMGVLRRLLASDSWQALDGDSGGPPYYALLDQPEFVIEAEVDADPAWVSLRSALCQDESVIDSFCLAVESLVAGLDCTVTFSDSLPGDALHEHLPFPATHLHEKMRAAFEHKRELWVLDFGREKRKLKCDQVFSYYLK